MMRSRYLVARLARSTYNSHCKTLAVPIPHAALSTQSFEGGSEKVVVSHERAKNASPPASSLKDSSKNADTSSEKVVTESCGDVDDDDMEQEEMFVEPDEAFEFRVLEWGGPRRGGRLPEPTRYGDWERKGRCTDF